jgi:NAD(P)-dependent dehydrogenase (short-subunit alcohol dehydrogenase family)
LNHLTTTIAVEEENITAISIRPGVVDTQMQTEVCVFSHVLIFSLGGLTGMI